jgi:hypothetical protein
VGESDLKVFITTGESSCSECGENLGRKAWITTASNVETSDLTPVRNDATIWLGGAPPTRAD